MRNYPTHRLGQSCSLSRNLRVLFAVVATLALFQRPSHAEAVTVEVTSPERQDIHREISLPGTLKPLEETVLFAKVSGFLSKINVDIGDRVKAGDLIAVLDIPEMEPEGLLAKAKLTEAKAHLSKAQSETDAARANAKAYAEKAKAKAASIRKIEVDARIKKTVFDRYKLLAADGSVTELEFDEVQGEFESAEALKVGAQAEVASAQADAKSARAQIKVAQSNVAVAEAAVQSASAEVARVEALASYARISALFDGIVTARYVDTGQLINEGTSSKPTAIVRIVRDRKLRLHFNVPEKEVPFIGKGTVLTFTPDAMAHQPLEAKVTRMAGELDMDSRTMRAEAIVNNKGGKLKPGMFVRLDVQMDIRKNALTIPAKTLVIHDGQTSVWLVEGGTSKLVPVKLGYDDGKIIEVLEGVSDSTQVVLSGQVNLRDGAEVRIAE